MTKQRKTIGRYRVVHEIGRGTTGIVYLARDPRIERRVAVKVLRNVEDHRDRFIKEAQSAGKLAHPNIVTVHDFGEHDHHPFIVMEHVEGCSLKDLLLPDNPPLDLARALMIVDQVCDGLHYAHEKGVVHRDIKPANIMVGSQDRVKLVDFGIARDGDSTTTQAGARIGTPMYMSPEQAQGKPADRRSDIFSVGLVLFEMLARRPAFEGETGAVYHAIIATRVPRLRELIPDFDADLDEIVARATEPCPEARYVNLAELRRPLKQAMSRLERMSPADHATVTAGDAKSGGLGDDVNGACIVIDQTSFERMVEGPDEPALRRTGEPAAEETFDPLRAMDGQAKRHGPTEARVELDAENLDSGPRVAIDRSINDPLNRVAFELDHETNAVSTAEAMAAQDRSALAQERREAIRKVPYRAARRLVDPLDSTIQGLDAGIDESPGRSEFENLGLGRRSPFESPQPTRLQAESRRARSQVVRPPLRLKAGVWLGGFAIFALLVMLSLNAPMPPASRDILLQPAIAETKLTPDALAAKSESVTGVLIIDAVPWAEIVQISRASGETISFSGRQFTPANLTLDGDDYRITLRNPSSSETREVTVRVTPSETARAFVSFTPVSADEYFRRNGFGDLQ